LATSQLVTQLNCHTVISLAVSSSHSCLVTQSTCHKWAYNKAVSCRKGSAQKQCSTRTMCRKGSMKMNDLKNVGQRRD